MAIDRIAAIAAVNTNLGELNVSRMMSPDGFFVRARRRTEVPGMQAKPP
jgi:hypothetical protein